MAAQEAATADEQQQRRPRQAATGGCDATGRAHGDGPRKNGRDGTSGRRRRRRRAAPTARMKVGEDEDGRIRPTG
jgi:hypothetical protein